MKTLIIFLSLISSVGYSAHECKGQKRIFYFNMPLMIGPKIFNDQLEICEKKGVFSGELTVPQRFKAKLENIKYAKDQLSFSITANEGRGSFKVFYSGVLKDKNKYFIGMAHLKNKKVLGPFMGVSSTQKIKLDVVQ